MKGKRKEFLGEVFLPGCQLCLFPGPESLQGRSPSRLRGCGRRHSAFKEDFSEEQDAFREA